VRRNSKRWAAEVAFVNMRNGRRNRDRRDSPFEQHNSDDWRRKVPALLLEEVDHMGRRRMQKEGGTRDEVRDKGREDQTGLVDCALVSLIVALDFNVYVFSLMNDLNCIFSTQTLMNPKGKETLTRRSRC